MRVQHALMPVVCALVLLGAQLGCSGGASGSSSTNITGSSGGTAKYVTVGTGGVIYHSADAVTWNAAVSGTTEALNDVAWNGTRFCAVGVGGTILHSENGEDWTATSSMVPTTLNAIAVSSSGVFCAVGNAVGGHSVVATSSDNGVEWFTHTQTGELTQNLNAVCWDGSRFCAAGGAGVTTTSIGGGLWTVPEYVTPATNLVGIAPFQDGGGHSRIVLGSNGHIYQAYGYNSDPWVDRSALTGFMGGGIASHGSLAVVSWFQNMAGGRVSSTPNLSGWNQVWTDPTAEHALTKVKWDGSRFIAVGANGSVVVSDSSGASWTHYAVPATTQTLQGIAAR